MLLVTHEIGEALTAVTRIAMPTPRPIAIYQWLDLPGPKGRGTSAPELARLRQEIIRRITGWSRSGCHDNGVPQGDVIYWLLEHGKRLGNGHSPQSASSTTGGSEGARLHPAGARGEHGLSP